MLHHKVAVCFAFMSAIALFPACQGETDPKGDTGDAGPRGQEGQVGPDGAVATPGANAGTFNNTVTFSLRMNGQPYVDANGLPSLEQKRMMGIRIVDGQYLTPLAFGSFTATGNAGQYTASVANAAYSVTASDAAIYGYMADGALNTEGTTLYDNVANAARTFNGFSQAATGSDTATISGCEKCHGTPYMKHGDRAAQVTTWPTRTAT